MFLKNMTVMNMEALNLFQPTAPPPPVVMETLLGTGCHTGSPEPTKCTSCCCPLTHCCQHAVSGAELVLGEAGQWGNQDEGGRDVPTDRDRNRQLPPHTGPTTNEQRRPAQYIGTPVAKVSQTTRPGDNKENRSVKSSPPSQYTGHPQTHARSPRGAAPRQTRVITRQSREKSTVLASTVSSVSMEQDEFPRHVSIPQPVPYSHRLSR
mmetsp:Transcript_12493/g.12574  ORF Transcript_12493/g.12574 Transcript_12493/m.12574 type:complete len:208 (+) Transcript_12493:1-624(+)